MDVTEKLMKEHQLILGHLDALKKIIYMENPSLVFDVTDSLLDFFESYADRYHHAKEEDILFKCLENPGVLTHCQPTQQMRYEHDCCRQYVQEMREACQKKDIGVFSQNARDYIEVLRDHIYKEDNILYPMAEESLSQSDKDTIRRNYDEVESLCKEDLDSKYQAKLEKILNDLEA